MSDETVWSKVQAENLVRHRGGTYYLRAKVNGKFIRRSLDTQDLRIAKKKRDAALAQLRSSSTNSPEKVRTVADALALAETREFQNPKLRENTVKYYEDSFKLLRRSLPLTLSASAWSKDAASAWWGDFAKANCASQANNGLRLVKKMSRVIQEAGLRFEDPTQHLNRMKPNPVSLEGLPPHSMLETICDDIRNQRKAKSKHAADAIEFLAWSGLRKSQARAVTWEDDEGEWLKIAGDITGSKGSSARSLPISPGLRRVLDKMKYPGASGPILQVRDPRQALTNACKRLGLSHLRIHDLRHWFATHAVEKGVDIPTVAKWLGHKDGGRLALMVYVEGREEHLLASAQKLG